MIILMKRWSWDRTWSTCKCGLPRSTYYHVSDDGIIKDYCEICLPVNVDMDMVTMYYSGAYISMLTDATIFYEIFNSDDSIEPFITVVVRPPKEDRMLSKL